MHEYWILLALFAGPALLGVDWLVHSVRQARRNTVRVILGGRRPARPAAARRPIFGELPTAASPRDRWAAGELPTQALLAHLAAERSTDPGRHRLAESGETTDPSASLALAP